MQCITERGYSISISDHHILVPLTHEDRVAITKIGQQRNRSKQESYLEYKRLDQSDQDRENKFGVAGELAFSHESGLPMNTDILPGGDGGVDFNTSVGIIGVKTAVLPKYLFLKHVQNCPCGLPADPEANVSGRLTVADILVLATVSADHSAVLLLGWETREQMLKQNKRIFDHRLCYENHFKAHESLRPMSELMTKLKEKQ